MGKQRGLGLHLFFICAFLVVTTYTCLGAGNMSDVCYKKERLALLKFKHSVEDHSGMLSSWVGNDCCMWEGIHCHSVTGFIERLHLRGGRGSGFGSDSVVDDNSYSLAASEVNSSLAELKHLKYLDLSGNDFRGSQIPEFIGSFKQLRYLNLSSALFEGIVPHSIGNISNLKILDLSQEGLTADDIAWTFGLSSLEYLDLSFLYLSDLKNWHMVLYMIPSLKELSLFGCRLSSGVDVVHFLNSSRILPNIKHLDLGFDSFNGLLPAFFQNMTSLAFLDLWCDSRNLLAWNFVTLLNMIPSLSELHLFGCGFDATFLSSPHLNFSTLSNIQHLDLRGNSITGKFPSVLTNMSSLKVLDLSQNWLTSSVPIMPNLLELDLSNNEFKQLEHVGIWRMCHLKQLSASYNHFDIELVDSPKNASECSQYDLERLDLTWSLNGTIPEPLGRLANLRQLDISYCGLTGPIPESLGRLRFLEVLDLSKNQLTGPIPTFFGNLSKLDLSFNQLNGSIPKSFGKLRALTEMNLGSNRLTGPIPTSLGRLVYLQKISVSSNLLNGPIPVSIGKLAKLHSLDMSSNSLEGIVSEAHLANLLMLKHLDASSNSQLTFNISPEWLPPFQLVTLQLSSCHITNGFPKWLQNQRKIEILVLSNAKITGPLPTWLRRMPIIPILDLSHNNLSGPLTSLPNGRNFSMTSHKFHNGYYQSLFMEYNLFNGSIPMSLCTRTQLQLLDLSRNRLTGKIPKCLENMKELIAMRFSSNRLSGVVPRSIALNATSLVQLKLNGNNLIGELALELGNLYKLEVLDLGNNKFSGNIPEHIGEELTSLTVLRLHKNNFTGRIPRSFCNITILQILDVAHNNLMGTIPNCLGELSGMVKGSFSRHLGDNVDPDENVVQVMKGVDLEYAKNWGMVVNMDLSSNKLVGEIPVELTTLSALLGLNLSNNHLSGGIPANIGNMTSLFSLDLSVNELIGVISPSIAALNFLSHLNLSHNNLSGPIPTGNQLQTLTDPSIYAGNKDLYGAPLTNNFSNHEDPPTMPREKYEASNERAKIWLFYLDVMSGFATGFWGIIGVLLFKEEWRWKLFMFVEETMDEICVAVMVIVAKMKRGRGEA